MLRWREGISPPMGEVFEHLPSVFEDAGAERCDHGEVYAVWLPELTRLLCDGGAISRDSKDEVGIFHPLQELRDGVAANRIAERFHFFVYLADREQVSHRTNPG